MNRTKRNRIITLATIGIAGLAIMGAAQVSSSLQAKNLDLLFPGKTTITDNGEGLTADYVDFKAKSQDVALKNAQDATQKTAEEGITLLKNENSALPLQKSTKVTILGYYSWHNNMSGGEDPATTQGAISIGKGLEARFVTHCTLKSEGTLLILLLPYLLPAPHLLNIVLQLSPSRETPVKEMTSP